MKPQRWLFSRIGFVISLGLCGSTARAQTQLFTFTGSAHDDAFGVDVNAVGDLDGDAIDDLIIGANGGDYARVYSGATGALLLTLTGAPNTGFGARVAGCGDLDGDGIGDLIVGMPSDASGELKGAIIVCSGRDGTTLYERDGDKSLDDFGRSVVGTGDLDGDGFADFLVGAPALSIFAQNIGYVRVFSGATGSVLKTLQPQFFGFGVSVANAGDVDADGAPDFIVGASTDASTGSASVYSSHDWKLLYKVSGEAANDNFGFSVAGGGDVNGDQVPDFIVGSPRESFSGLGYAFVCSGVDGKLLFRFEGDGDPVIGEAYGAAVSHAGDVNDDGVDDFLAGALFEGADLAGAGRVSIYSGRSGQRIYALDGAHAGDELGRAVRIIPDLNGDGRSDLLIGITGDDGAAKNAGRASVLAGNDLFHFAQPRIAKEGDLLTHTTREGKPGLPAILAVTAVNDTSLFLVVGGVGTFDGTGTRALAVTVPAGLAGLTLKHRAFALNDNGYVIDSADEVVTFQ